MKTNTKQTEKQKQHAKDVIIDRLINEQYLRSPAYAEEMARAEALRNRCQTKE